MDRICTVSRQLLRFCQEHRADHVPAASGIRRSTVLSHDCSSHSYRKVRVAVFQQGEVQMEKDRTIARFSGTEQPGSAANT